MYLRIKPVKTLMHEVPGEGEGEEMTERARGGEEAENNETQSTRGGH